MAHLLLRTHGSGGRRDAAELVKEGEELKRDVWWGRGDGRQDRGDRRRGRRDGLQVGAVNGEEGAFRGLGRCNGGKGRCTLRVRQVRQR